jgi:hypothetical protein
MPDLATRLARTDPRLRTALLHHARGEHRLARDFMDRFLANSPLDRNFLNAEQVAAEILRTGKEAR